LFVPFYINGSKPYFLYFREILSFFKGNRKKYEKFVREGLDKEINLEIVNQRYLGDEAFMNRMRKMKSKSAIDYHLRKMRDDQECREILKDIEKNKEIKF